MNIIVLAAGKGIRMKSELPKVLSTINGKPLIQYVLDTVAQLPHAHIVVVVGYKKELVLDAIDNFHVDYAEQKEQLGTAHAVQCAFEKINRSYHETLIICGDTPLITLGTIHSLHKEHSKTEAVATVLTTKLTDPGAYGRIIRGQSNEVLKIVEYKDATPAQRMINEINSGTYIFNTEILIDAVKQIKNNNAQKEYYLTDTLEIIRNQGQRVSAFCAENSVEVSGVNSVQELASLEALLSKSV